MATTKPTSTKRILIDKNNATVVIVIAAMAFLTVFSVVASRSLLSQRSYQTRVITQKKLALDQLKTNNKEAIKLVNSYKTFVSSSNNIIGGDAGGSQEKDGDNARIVLDALPSKYDFPSVANSLEKILTKLNFKIVSIGGSDDELRQSAPPPKATATPPVLAPIDMPFEFSVSGSLESAQVLSDTLQRSIRPIKISKIIIDAKDGNLNLTVSAKTYYQPQKVISITTKVIK